MGTPKIFNHLPSPQSCLFTFSPATRRHDINNTSVALAVDPRRSWKGPWRWYDTTKDTLSLFFVECVILVSEYTSCDDGKEYFIYLTHHLFFFHPPPYFAERNGQVRREHAQLLRRSRRGEIFFCGEYTRFLFPTWSHFYLSIHCISRPVVVLSSYYFLLIVCSISLSTSKQHQKPSFFLVSCVVVCVRAAGEADGDHVRHVRLPREMPGVGRRRRVRIGFDI